MLIARRIALLLAIWLAFECTISWLATCQQGYQAASTEGYPKDCSIFQGPLASVTRAFGRTWASVFNHADAYVALFTAILVISTTALWWATYGLQKTTRDLAEAGERQIAVAKESADAAKQSADVARDTLIATNRPWIQIKSITITGPLGFGREFGNDSGGGVELEIRVKNVGKSPAIRVGAYVWLDGSFDHTKNQKRLSAHLGESLKQPNVVRPENTIFPDDELTISVKAWTMPDQMDEVRQRAANSPDNKAYFAVIGCVYYEMPFASSWHQTGIILDLRKMTPYPADTKPTSYSAVPPERFEPNMTFYHPYRVTDGVHLEGFIPADDLILQRSFVGTSPID